MAQSKDDVKYGAAQVKLSEDDALRAGYWGGVPLESGKIAESEPVDLLSAAHNISKVKEAGESGGGGGGQQQEGGGESRRDKETDQRETNRNNLAASLLPPPPVGESRGSSG